MKQLIIKLFKEINEECFENKLTLNFDIKISRSKRCAGAVRYSIIGGRVFIKELQISKEFVMSEKELKNVIAHEMIHIWEAQILRIKPSHSYQFKNKMEEINRSNPSYNVSLKHTLKLKVPEVVSRDAKYILSEDKTKITFVNIAFNMERLSKVLLEKNYGKDYKVGFCKIKNNFSIQRDRIKYNYLVNEEKLKYITFLS